MSSKLRNSCVENRQLHKFGYNIHKLCYRSKAESASGLESVFIFQFLNDKIHNDVKQNMIVNFIIQKLENKHSFLKS